MEKNFVSGSGAPVACSSTAAAVGPCNSYRYSRGGLSVRTAELSSRSVVTR
jgi:hypothetical protein